MATPSTKVCSHCGIDKPVTRFVRSRTRKDGRHPSCKDCRREYESKNRFKIVWKQRIYNSVNKEKIRASHKAYAAKRFFYIRANNLKLRHGDNCASTSEIAWMWKKQRGICPLTGIRLNKYNAQIDHVVPISKGGTGAIDNLRWINKDANYAKRDLSDREFISLCRSVAQRNPL